jgi:dUTPase
MKDSVIKLHEDEGYRTGLVVSVGHKYIGVIYPDSSGMKIRKIKLDSKYCVIDYPTNKAKKMLRNCGKKFGITKGAKVALRA